MARLLVDGESPREPGTEQFELSGWVDTAPFEDLLGLTIESAAGGEAVLSLPFVVRLAQGAGLLHGGALTALADTAVAMAIKSLLPPGTAFATIELTTRFLAPVLSGRVVARARVHAPVGRTFHGEARLEDAVGREVARFTSIFRVAKGQGFDEES